METLDTIAGTAALIMIVVVIASKVVSTRMAARLKDQISQISRLKQNSLNRLKQAQSQRTVVVKNKGLLERKKSSLEKELSRLKQEQAEAKEEEDARRQRLRATVSRM